jgi:hypothetical protein
MKSQVEGIETNSAAEVVHFMEKEILARREGFSFQDSWGG